ncbi:MULTISPECIES: helix-turn-helix domain-containing protein [Bacillus cereus group]|uniref:helix-turn-helix domain-containing protein n=1 Tax=Bacillus cereus group TaxID=86661 RepID=UPI000BEBBC49|nr:MULTISPECIES: helix-turn-helix transcriptional regulator [Bacillus cereus group]PDY76971.1 transcriptional regulator [Bacillus cereus]
MIIFGKTLRQLRKSRDLTQIELAEILNLSQSQIKNWETGRFQPDIETLANMASFFNVSLDVLVGFSNNFEDEPIQQVISEARSTYGALNDAQKERFCNQLLLFMKMIKDNQGTF